MKRIHSVPEGVLSLFEAGQREPVRFVYEEATYASLCAHILWDGQEIPVFHWRYSLQNHGIYTTIPQLGELSTLKTLDFVPNTCTMRQELLRELDLAEWFLRSQVVSIMGYGAMQAANFIVRMKSGAIVNLEISVTLPQEAKRETKHTVFTTNGMVSDMAAGNVVVQDQVHLYNYGKHPAGYRDDDINLFGLSLEEQDICYAIYALITGYEDPQQWKERRVYLKGLAEAAVTTLTTGKKWNFNPLCESAAITE